MKGERPVAGRVQFNSYAPNPERATIVAAVAFAAIVVAVVAVAVVAALGVLVAAAFPVGATCNSWSLAPLTPSNPVQDTFRPYFTSST
jgi:membrane-associated protease RseP (regulator of RpoE activity)